MFNEQAAKIVQFVSFFLETIGFSLMYFEMKFPLIIDVIENRIDGLEEIVRKRCYQIIEEGQFHQVFSTFTVIALFFAVIPHFVGFWQQILPAYMQIPYSIIIILILAGVTIYFSILLLFGFVDFLDFLNRFNEGKAVGTLGFLIGLLGLLGELYQVITIIVN